MSNVAFLKEPAPLNLTGNPISFRIAGKNAFTGNLTRAYASFYITGSTPWAVETYLRFAYGGRTITFYCKTTPSDSLLEFPSLIQYSELVGYLRKNFELATDYEITYGVNGITLWARKLGEQFNMVITSDWSAGFGAYPPTNNTEHVLNDFYKIGINVEKLQTVISGNDIYYVLANIELPVSNPLGTDTLPEGFTANGTGVIQTDISELLQEIVNGKFTFPEPDTGWAMIHVMIKQFRIYAYEKLTGDDIGIYSENYRIMPGKLSTFRQGELNYLEKSIYDKLTESKMFLTWAPLEKVTDIYAPEKLYFLFVTTGIFRLRTKEYYSDGSVSEVTRFTFTVYDAWKIYEFFVSYSRVRTNAPKKVLRYEISLLDSNSDLASEIRTFIIDYTYQKYARYFFFKNSFGVYELVRTTGKVIKSLNISKEFINIPLPDNFKQVDKAEKQINADAETLYKINSGYLPDKYWADWFQEFLLSEDVYWLKRGKAYPCNIRESKNQISEDGDYNPYQEFELTHSIHDDFTEEFTAHEPIIIGDFNLDFNTDFFTGGEPPEPPAWEIWELPVNEQFSNWLNGVPEDWFIQNEALVLVSNSSNRVRIDIAYNNTYYTTGIRHMADFGNTTVRLTIKVDEINHKDAFYVVFQEVDGLTRARTLDVGVNVFDIDLSDFMVFSFTIQDQTIVQYGGAYPHYITIDYITIEELV